MKKTYKGELKKGTVRTTEGQVKKLYSMMTPEEINDKHFYYSDEKNDIVDSISNEYSKAYYGLDNNFDWLILFSNHHHLVSETLRLELLY